MYTPVLEAFPGFALIGDEVYCFTEGVIDSSADNFSFSGFRRLSLSSAEGNRINACVLE